MNWKKAAATLMAAGMTLGTAFSASAADYPEREITIVVPFDAGGSSDMSSRIVATGMEEVLGETILVENRSGGTGSVGSVPLWVIGVVYFAVRIVGKYFGAFVGCLAAHKPKRVRNYLGLALIPQAGVAIGLAALGARTLGGSEGESLNTIILASSVLYEMIGPVCAKLSLSLSKSYSTKIEEIAPIEESAEPKSEVEILIERINKIQKELPAHNLPDAEQAFTEAAEEQLEAMGYGRRKMLCKR